MTTTLDRRPRVRLLLCLLALTCAFALQPAPGSAIAADEPGEPVFSAPTDITNEYLPFNPGSVTVFAGREGGGSILLVRRQLPETREFPWDGGIVTCRVVETLGFRHGEKISSEHVYVAQSDAGGVWAFGEVDDEDDDPDDDDGDDKDEPSGWIVGQRAPADPVDVVEGGAPALLMPAVPEKGDVWSTEAVAPHFVVTREVKSTRKRLRVQRGRQSDVLKVRDLDVADNSAETRWFAKDIGLVRARGPGERLTLRASTFRSRR